MVRATRHTTTRSSCAIFSCVERRHGACGRSASGSVDYDAAATVSSSAVAAGRCAFQSVNAALPESESA